MSKTKESKEHVALYRKYRPQGFRDVIGQDHVVKVLEGALKLGNIFHAYIFAGSRGTGKTSVARIFAREIGTAPEDVYEIDAASNTGVDDIRALNESVSTLPFRSPYKVYILDEVHMLSKSAFNALLKTLEEPPKHVVFILATTEIEKLPETVISRCQLFQFKKPTQHVLKELVIRVAKSEGFTLEPSAAELIALLGDSSFRDTQSILQKVLSFSKDKSISVGEVETVTGAPKSSLVRACTEAVLAKNLEGALKAIGTAADEDVDAGIFLKLLLEQMRLIFLLRFGGGGAAASEVSAEELAFLKAAATRADAHLNSGVLSELIAAGDKVSRSPIPYLPLELAFIKLLQS